jgi:hypothetical protein
VQELRLRRFTSRPPFDARNALVVLRKVSEKELPPEGLRRIWPVAALLVGYRPTVGYAPSSRLATGQIGRNERHRIYVPDH